MDIITNATDVFPEIEWDITHEVLEHDPDERLTSYKAVGRDFISDKKYLGIAIYVCGEFQHIDDIELQ